MSIYKQWAGLSGEDLAYTQQVSSRILHLILLSSSNDQMEKSCSNQKAWFLGSTPVLFLQDNFHSKYQTSETAQRKSLSNPSNLNSMNVIWFAVSSLGSNERGN